LDLYTFRERLLVPLEILGNRLVDVELAQCQDPVAHLVLFDPKLDVIEEHVINHGEHIEPHIFFVHLQELQAIKQLLQLFVAEVEQLPGAKVLLVVTS